MRRTWWFRPLATLLTLWLPLIVGEPSMLQPCETHGSVAVASAAASSAKHAAGQHHESHSGHHVAGASTTTSGHDSAPGHQHNNCSCIGCCTGSPAVTPTFGAQITSIVVATYVAASAPVEAAALPRPAPAFSRPYTTGPPRA